MIFDRETIGAYVDGELNEIERRRIEAAMAGDAELARTIEAERRLRSMLSARFDPIASEPVPERLAAAVRESVKVVPILKPRTWRAQHWAAIAATFAIGIVTAQFVSPRGDMVERGGTLVARGALRQALETQLASAQPTDAPVRIGLTFKSTGGEWCRSFTRAATEGIACRSVNGWTLERTAANPAATGAYRQAGSGDLTAAAQAMAADAPLDAAQERATVAAGWH